MITNRFSKYLNGGELKSLWQDHLKEYWITSPTDSIDLKLDIVGEETLVAESDVTDHYVESNIAYQDQIATKPKTYTIQGEVGELVWYQKDSVSQVAGQVAQRLEGVVSFLPVRSRSFQQMKSKVMKAAQWVDTASNILDRFGDLTPDMTKQEQAYKWLLFWRDVRYPLSIKTPWGTLENYVVTSLRLTQPKETKDKSYISMTFKELRLSSVSTVEFSMEKYQRIAGLENQPKVENGTTSGKDAGIAQTNDDGDEFCVISTADEDTLFQVLYEEESKKVDVFDTIAKETVPYGTERYYKAIDAARAQCAKQIETEGWNLPK